MKAYDPLWLAGFLFLPLAASAATRYVNLSNLSPVVPYTSWATAARTIQDAVDAAVTGDEILVTNGVYVAGGMTGSGKMNGRVAITKAVTVISVNGPLVTFIEGRAAPVSTNGNGAIRCAYVGTNAILSGFTLTNGHTTAFAAGGGAWCEESGLLTNCTLIGNSASEDGGGVCGGTLNNCTLIDNWTKDGGGGAAWATLTSCTLLSNVAAVSGGGAYYGTLNHCTVKGNVAPDGGGTSMSTLNHCALIGNSAGYRGGGASGTRLTNCTLIANSAIYGGGACQSFLANCTLSGNSAIYGGGAYQGTLNNCTLTGNAANICGGGAYSGRLNNCIVYYNSSPNGPNYHESTLNYCCTTPLPEGPGNLDSEPLLSSTSHLSAQSPCIGRGGSDYSGGVDIDGENWLNPPCIGADQLTEGQTSGALVLTIDTVSTNIAAGFAASFIALSSGRINGTVWDFGDGTVVSNRAYASHAWSTPGLYEVRLKGYNENWPDGFDVMTKVKVGAREVYYVDAANQTPRYPHTSWAGAATNIQDAIDAGKQLGRLVLAADGVYKTGGRPFYGTITNRIAVVGGVELRSVNGPLVTIIEGLAGFGSTNGNGNGAARCAYVGAKSVLSGFTLTNGHTRATSAGDSQDLIAGGVWCDVSGIITNCTLIGNSAGLYGGGVHGGQLNDCRLVGNFALESGGGAYNANLNNCTLIGNSAADSGGGSYCGTLNNCFLMTNSSQYYAGGAYDGRLTNCTLVGNSGRIEGGGAWKGNLNTCTLSGNSAANGGGSYGGRLTNCILIGNSGKFGAGAHEGTLSHCTLTGNSATDYGGGAHSASLLNCTLSSNLAGFYGGGAYDGKLTNCTLVGNSAVKRGGGATSGTLVNCTLTGNSANYYGGGTDGATLNNCIVYYNSAPFNPNHIGSTLSYCCAIPLPDGLGNISAEPLLASATHLSTASPCIGRGSSAFSSGVDIDGEKWIDPPCMGADQVIERGATGALELSIDAAHASALPGFLVAFEARIEGRLTHSVWDFGDGTVLSNCPYATHSWDAPGQYEVRLTAYNDSWPQGISTTVSMKVGREVYYVDASNATPVYPYTNWAGAAANLQDAIDAGRQIGRLVLVNDGVYSTGGRVIRGFLTNRVALIDGIEVRSVNGPRVTFIVGGAAPGLTNGDGAVRCAYLGSNTVLSGFTLTNGHTLVSGESDGGGGGAFCEVSAIITNCLLTGNSAQSGGGVCQGTLVNCNLSRNSSRYLGGGALSATLTRCTLSDNSAGSNGGGASGCILNNCTLSGNSAKLNGGGTAGGTLNNSIVYFNSAPNGYGPNYFSSTFKYSCTSPLPPGLGNVENDPAFVDNNGWSNLRLRATSPCINAGKNTYAPNSRDLDGNPGVVGETVDMGAYEFQSPASTISYAWLQQYGLSNNGLADFEDSDIDGFNNWQEWIAGTDPTNSASVLRMLTLSPGTNTAIGITASWTSVTNRAYALERASVLDLLPAFAAVRTNIAGLNNTTSFTDTNATGPGPFFYRVRVER